MVCHNLQMEEMRKTHKGKIDLIYLVLQNDRTGLCDEFTVMSLLCKRDDMILFAKQS